MTVQGPVKEQQPDGMSHGGGGVSSACVMCIAPPCARTRGASPAPGVGLHMRRARPVPCPLVRALPGPPGTRLMPPLGFSHISVSKFVPRLNAPPPPPQRNRLATAGHCPPTARPTASNRFGSRPRNTRPESPQPLERAARASAPVAARRAQPLPPPPRPLPLRGPSLPPPFVRFIERCRAGPLSERSQALLRLIQTDRTCRHTESMFHSWTNKREVRGGDGAAGPVPGRSCGRATLVL